MKCSVIVPTYNRPAALKLCLLSLTRQSRLPDEVLIADDGSGQETRDLVDVMRRELEAHFPLRHIWQEDIGFRKPRILNETVRQSTGDYLIFLDGDCMAHRHFVRAHLEYSEPSAVLGGKRVEIGRELSEKIMSSGIPATTFTFGLLWDAVRKRSRRVGESIYVKNKLIRRLFHRDRIHDRAIWGCNFSLSKQLFYDINGCDEDFLDGSAEDIDIGIRAVNSGNRLKSVRALAIIFHLWHRSSWSAENEKGRYNLAILQRRIDNREPYCLNGIRKRS